MTIYFDMDGTIADFYGVPNWLQMLYESNPLPYIDAKPMQNFSVLAKRLNKVQQAGIRIGIISWTSKNGSEEFNGLVEVTKRAWLRKHLRSVKWDEVEIIPYGTNKSDFVSATAEDILFDDEAENRNAWAGTAYPPESIMDILKEMF